MNESYRLKPLEALSRLENLFGGGAPEAKRIIADKIREGSIQAWAKRVWVTTEPILKLARRDCPPTANRNVAIKRQQLIGAEEWTELTSVWKWRRGEFFANVQSFPIKRRIYRGVRLAGKDIDRLVHEAKLARRKDISESGAPGKTDMRDDAWLEIIGICMKRGFTVQDLGQQQVVVQNVLELLKSRNGSAALAASSVEKIVSKFYGRFSTQN